MQLADGTQPPTYDRAVPYTRREAPSSYVDASWKVLASSRGRRDASGRASDSDMVTALTAN